MWDPAPLRSGILKTDRVPERRATIKGMRLKPCSSCERLVRAGDACPFCGETGVPTTFAPHLAAVFLSLPLLAASACTRPIESIYGGPEMMDPAPPPAADSSSPVPEKPAEADPPEPTEPQGEIYGSPQMMDSSADKPELPEPAPGPDSGGNQPCADDPDEADAPKPPEPDEPIYGGPGMMDPEPEPVPEPSKKRRRRRGR